MYAASCAIEHYQAACTSCSFDSGGKMDKNCYENYQERAKNCVAVAYPIMAYNYKGGSCPALDECASELQSCKDNMSTGNDKDDCSGSSVKSCFTNADACAAAAAKECDQGVDLSAVADSLWGFCPWIMVLCVMLIGAAYVKHKQ